MDTVLALLALILSLVALALALRARRAPAPPPPAPAPPSEDEDVRPGLDRLEARHEALAGDLSDLADRVGRLEAGWGEEADTLREGFASMELAFQALREAAPDPTLDVDEEPAPEPTPTAPEERVREHLGAAGWTDIILLPRGESRFGVEARRDGGLAKGSARLYPDGRVEAQLARPTRAFP